MIDNPLHIEKNGKTIYSTDKPKVFLNEDGNPIFSTQKWNKGDIGKQPIFLATYKLSIIYKDRT